MKSIFFRTLDLLKQITTIQKLNLYGEHFADFTVEKDGQVYVVSIRKEEQNDA